MQEQQEKLNKQEIQEKQKKTEQQKKRKQKHVRDERVNTTMIKKREYLLMGGILFLFTDIIIALENFLVDHKWTAIGISMACFILVSFIYYILIRYVRRVYYGRPIETIADAARQIAQGDFSVRISPLRNDGKKDEVEVLIEDFNEMAEKLQKTEMLGNDFISNVSHELKTPMNIILSYSQLLKDPELTEQERNSYVNTIMDAARGMNTMTGNILRLNKLEHQEIELNRQKYQLGEQLRQCALGYMEQWERKNISFDIDVEDVLICQDASLLEIVWNNLLSNAIKYTDAGGSISLTSRLQKAGDGTGKDVIVSMRDSGCGMEQETMERIFDKFYQGDMSHSKEGNGLGLPMVKKILEISGGRIRVESAPGEGSCFHVSLPVAE